jgi:hypothetical protein
LLQDQQEHPMPEHRMLALKERLFSGLRENEKYFFQNPATNAQPQAP